DRAGLADVAAEAGRGVVLGDLHIVVDLHAIVIDRHPGHFGFLAVLAFRRVVLDVIALPDGWRLAGVHFRHGHAVHCAAVADLTFQAVAVEHLHFIAALDIDAAVAATLPLGLRHVGDAELDVQLESAVESLFGDDVAARSDLHGAAVDELPRGLGLAV